MADDISRINDIRPTYPVKPVHPSEKERRSGQDKRPTKKRRPKDAGDGDGEAGPSNDNDQRTIDEFI